MYPLPSDRGPGIPWDMVSNRAVYILLECFLVPDTISLLKYLINE